jgi:hypothetical protein
MKDFVSKLWADMIAFCGGLFGGGTGIAAGRSMRQVIDDVDAEPAPAVAKPMS